MDLMDLEEVNSNGDGSPGWEEDVKVTIPCGFAPFCSVLVYPTDLQRHMHNCPNRPSWTFMGDANLFGESLNAEDLYCGCAKGSTCPLKFKWRQGEPSNTTLNSNTIFSSKCRYCKRERHLWSQQPSIERPGVPYVPLTTLYLMVSAAISSNKMSTLIKLCDFLNLNIPSKPLFSAVAQGLTQSVEKVIEDDMQPQIVELLLAAKDYFDELIDSVDHRFSDRVEARWITETHVVSRFRLIVYTRCFFVGHDIKIHDIKDYHLVFQSLVDQREKYTLEYTALVMDGHLKSGYDKNIRPVYETGPRKVIS